MQSSLPQSIKVLLWDTDLESISLTKNFQFVIERILEYGDLPDIKWMETTFSHEQIIQTLKDSRRISVKSGNFFAWKYKLPQETLQCLQQPYQNKQDRF